MSIASWPCSRSSKLYGHNNIKLRLCKQLSNNLKADIYGARSNEAYMHVYWKTWFSQLPNWWQNDTETREKMKSFSSLLLCELNSAHCCWHTSLKGCLGIEKKAVLFLFKYYLLGEKKHNELDSLQFFNTLPHSWEELHLNIVPFLKRGLVRALTLLVEWVTHMWEAQGRFPVPHGLDELGFYL